MARDKILSSAIINFQDLPKHVGIAVVGGGLTGLQLASELYSYHASDVLVLEIGKILEPKHINLAYDSVRAEQLWLHPSEDECFWQPWRSESPPHFAGWGGLRRRLGGRSLYWHGVTIPMDDWALVEPWWPPEIIEDLTKTWRGGPSLYDLANQEVERWSGLPIETTSLKGEPSKLFNALGFEDSYIVPAMVRQHYLGTGESRFFAYSPVELWFDTPTSLASNVISPLLPLVACEVEVLGIMLNGKGIKGVRVRNKGTGEITEIFCDVIVLAAGTIENSRLAIQALAETRGPGTGPIVRGLCDHIVQGFACKIPLKDLPDDLTSTLNPERLYLVKGSKTTRSNLFISLRVERQESLILDLWSMGEQIPNLQSYVRCEVRRDWPWPTFVRSALSAEDDTVLSNQQSELNNTWARICGLTKHRFNPLGFVNFDHPQRVLPEVLPRVYGGEIDYYAPITWASPLGTIEHEGGTLPYGSILDHRGEFHEIEGLFATGPCTFPRMGAANPGLTNLALAKRLAAEITK